MAYAFVAMSGGGVMAINKHASVFKQGVVASIAVTGAVLSLLSEVAIAQSKPGANGSDTAIHQVVVNGPEEDPNMPNLPYALPNAPLFWSPGPGTSTKVTFTKSPGGKGVYLGFNNKGSWIKNESDGKVYVWNLKELTLTLGAASEYEVPMDLRNPSDVFKGEMLARSGGKTSTSVANNNAGRRTPYIPPNVGGNTQPGSGETRTGIFSPSTGTNGAGVGTATQVKGSAATIRAGVLTFTNEEGASVSLKVVRPPNQALTNPNAKPTGNAGVWIGEDPKNSENVVQLYVQDNGTVSGTVMSGMVAQAMKRMMMATPPHQ
jgi:hypothetical protein